LPITRIKHASKYTKISQLYSTIPIHQDISSLFTNIGGHSSENVDGLGDFLRIYLRGICNNPSSKTVAHKDNLVDTKHPKIIVTT
jgi:hypothetical protein